MLKVGIIGCGRIADQHAVEIKKNQDCELVGVCDSEILMAKQLCERFHAKGYYNHVGEFMKTAKPDVVHLTTPPQSHVKLGKQCLEAGANVFFEKPFALNVEEGKEIIDFATKKGLKITVGHNVQFCHVAVQMRQLVRSGFLGGDPVHMESIWCYSLKDPGYTKAVLGEKDHWVRGLPGKLLHNIISHGVCKIAEYLKTEKPRVMALGYSSPLMRRAGEPDIFDELRVIINDGENAAAFFTFSTQISPPIHQFRLYGPERSLVIDDLHQTLVEVSKNHKSYLNHFIPPLVEAKQYLTNSCRNIKRFVKRESYFEEGRRTLVEKFYRSIQKGDPLPIPYKEIVLTSRIMDDIFCQLRSQRQTG